jgi:hypothetical protein
MLAEDDKDSLQGLFDWNENDEVEFQTSPDHRHNRFFEEHDSPLFTHEQELLPRSIGRNFLFTTEKSSLEATKFSKDHSGSSEDKPTEATVSS